jgi:hypothetical protein
MNYLFKECIQYVKAIMQKICTKCNTVKELEGFYKRANGRHGRAARCIACVKQARGSPEAKAKIAAYLKQKRAAMDPLKRIEFDREKNRRYAAAHTLNKRINQTMGHLSYSKGFKTTAGEVRKLLEECKYQCRDCQAVVYEKDVKKPEFNLRLDNNKALYIECYACCRKANTINDTCGKCNFEE